MLQTLLEKLQLKDERNLLIQGLPSTIEKQFAKLAFSKNLSPLLKIRKIDFALVFAVNEQQLGNIIREVLPALPAGRETLGSLSEDRFQDRYNPQQGLQLGMHHRGRV